MSFAEMAELKANVPELGVVSENFNKNHEPDGPVTGFGGT